MDGVPACAASRGRVDEDQLVDPDEGEDARTPGLVDTDHYGQGWMFEAGIDSSMLNEQFAGQMGTIMAGFVPNWGYKCSKNRRDGRI